MPDARREPLGYYCLRSRIFQGPSPLCRLAGRLPSRRRAGPLAATGIPSPCPRRLYRGGRKLSVLLLSRTYLRPFPCRNSVVLFCKWVKNYRSSRFPAAERCCSPRRWLIGWEACQLPGHRFGDSRSTEYASNWSSRLSRVAQGNSG